MTEYAQPAVTRASSQTPRLSWPPPGLESLQGELWIVIGEFAVGVVILAVPLLLAIATQPQFWSLGPFGQSWWVPLATSTIGLIVLGVSTYRLWRLLRGAARAARFGYSVGTIITVACDLAKDSGFVLQGARVFGSMNAVERKALLSTRAVRAICYLLAALWIPIGLAISVFLAAAASIGTGGVWIITLIPAVIFGIAGTAAGVSEAIGLRRVRRTNAASAHDETRREAGEWTGNLALVADDAAIANRRVRPRAFTLAAIAILIPTILLIGPVGAVVTSAAMGPVLARVAVPRFGKTQERIAIADAMRSYRTQPDPRITPLQAGASLMNLAYAGRALERDALVKEPTVRYPTWPAPPKGWDLGYEAASGKIFSEIRTLPPELRAYVDSVVAHPALSEFATVAYAARADINGAHFKLPFPDTMSISSLPIMRFAGLREASYARIAAAAVAFEQGRNADAERMIKETISLGFVLLDDGTTLIENLIGSVMIGSGVKALEEFYRASGRKDAADQLLAAHDAAERAATLATSINPDQSALGLLSTMPQVVTNPETMRGLRWETFATFSSFAPCLNLHSVVFGPGSDYDRWVNETRISLVRSPADAEVFAVARGGFLGTKARPARRCVPTGRFARLVREGALF